MQDLETNLPISKIIVGYGTNDWILRASLSELEEVVREMLNRLSELYPTTEALWRSDWQTERKMGSFSQMSKAIEKVSKLFPLVTFINCLTCIDHTEEVFADGFLHPDKKGFSLYAHTLRAIWCRYLSGT
ncbi:MAG: SGNH/GDSL hydrolase family protein [Sphaerochaeta sp.]|nr:SGNH/GDSL hydrolase family protein [Sphaerochaeta sp.]